MEQFFFKSTLFEIEPGIDTSLEKNKLEIEVERILKSEPNIQLVEEP